MKVLGMFKAWRTHIAIITLICSTSFAVEFAGGTGEPNDPYQIARAEQLISIGSDPNLLDKHFLLVNDIDLDPNLPGGQVFTQAVIAPDVNDKIFFQGTAFTGCFDGNGHRISNLTIYADTKFNLGLFGRIGAGGRVQNLRMEDVSIAGAIGTWYRGGLAGGNLGSVTDCSVSGNLIGSFDIGGLVGANGGKICGCYASGQVTGNGSLGGLVGSNGGTISDSYATVNVSSRKLSPDLGGLVGSNYEGTIVNCYAVGTVFNAFIEDSYMGGLLGFSFSLPDANVINCFWDTEVSGIHMSDGGKGLTTAQMMDPNVYSLNGWGNDPNWVLDPGKDYPRLAWEGKAGQIIPEPNIDWFDGSGTHEDPFIVTTADQLARIGTASILWDKSFVLVSDLDLMGIDFQRIGICLGTDFTGTFDGRNHTISNLTTGTDLIPVSYFGLFGYIGPEGCVSRLTLKSTTIKCGLGSEKVGILAGVNRGTITDSCVTGSVSGGHYYVGGLVGKNRGSIANCCSMASVSGGKYSHYLGGLVGINSSQISSCYAKGNITGGDNSEALGGLVGEHHGSIINCYAATSVSGGDMSSYLGGLVGSKWSGSIENCYAIGSISSGDGSRRLGGLIGYDNRERLKGGAISHSFWDIQTSGLSLSEGGTGLTTAEMQDINTYLNDGWDFVDEVANGNEDIWKMPPYEGYPLLAWQEVPAIAELIAYWRFDETSGDIAYDSAGNNDAALHQIEFTEGKIGGAYLLNGFNSYIDCGDSVALGPEQMTLTMWLEPRHMGGVRYIVSRAKKEDLDDIDYTITRHLAGEIEFVIAQLDSVPVSALSTAITPLGEWSHLAVCLDGSEASIYINGQLDSSTHYSQRVPREGHRLVISSHQGSTRFYYGKIDDVRIYNGPLNEQDILSLANPDM